VWIVKFHPALKATTGVFAEHKDVPSRNGLSVLPSPTPCNEVADWGQTLAFPHGFVLMTYNDGVLTKDRRSASVSSLTVQVF
jgi:hypothetical protein